MRANCQDAFIDGNNLYSYEKFALTVGRYSAMVASLKRREKMVQWFCIDLPEAIIKIQLSIFALIIVWILVEGFLDYWIRGK